MLAHALIPGLWEDCHKLEASVDYAVSSKQAWAGCQNLSQKLIVIKLKEQNQREG